MRIANVSIRFPVFAAVINIVLVVAGAVALPRVGVDLFPNVDLPIVTVTTIYPGADPRAVESKVSRPLEEALNTLSGLESMRSTSMENVSVVILRFALSEDGDQAATDVQNQVSSVLGALPAEIDAPIVRRFDVGAAPILSVALSGDMPLPALTQVADDVVKARLQRVAGVGIVDIVGGQEREVQVLVGRERLSRFGLTVGDLQRAIAVQNLEVPGGRIEVDGTEFTVKTRGEVDSVAALRDIVLTDMGNRPVRLGDVADVFDGAEEARSASDLDGTTAVSLLIVKQSGSNTVEVAEQVRGELDALGAVLPEGVELAIAVDNSLFIEASMNDVRFDLMFGAVLAVLIILFFLRDLRATLISAIALPTSVMATIAFIAVMDFTFNNMTMLALTLSIGILIDDAIVVIENIHRHLGMGKAPREAASEGTAEIGLAVMAITAAIIAVFVPVATMKGTIGRFFFEFGMTVAFAVGVSMFTSLTITPMLSSRLLRHGHQAPGLISRSVGAVLEGVDRIYRLILTAALRFKPVTLLLAAGVFAGSLALAAHLPLEFLPPEDRGEFRVAFELPTGTPLAETRAFAAELRRDLAAMPGVTMTLTRIGAGAQGTVERGDVHVELVPRDERDFTTLEAIARTRDALGDRSPARTTLEKIDSIGGGGGFGNHAIQLALRGDDLDQLAALAEGMVTRLSAIPGFVDIDTNASTGKPELSIAIDREAAADAQAPIVTIATTIRTLVNGEKVTEVPLDGERVDVRLRQHPDERRTIDDLKAIRVRGGDGRLVDLRSLVSIEEGRGPGQIERQAQRRQVVVLANLDGIALGEGIKQVNALVAELVPVGIDTAFLGRSQTMQESMGYMIEAIGLAMVLVFLILAAQFNSWLHPFTIMMSLPLTTIGAFGALWLFGMSISIFAMIGFIMLIGLVTKNAVLLVDYTNTLRSRGMAVHEAIIEAGVVRLRPILMTTAAMVFGMLPVALAQSLGGEQRAPMAITVMGGLVASTVLTLVVVPVIYSLVEGVRALAVRLWPRAADQPEHVDVLTAAS